MVKLIGLVLIVASCTSLGILKNKQALKRLKELEDYIHGFEILKSEIEYHLTPLQAASYEVGNLTKGPVKEVFLCFSRLLEDKVSDSTLKLWEEALNQEGVRQKTYLITRDYEILLSFGKVVGYLDKKMQQKNIVYLIQNLQEQLNQGKETYRRTGKLYQGMGLLIGICIGIILI